MTKSTDIRTLKALDRPTRFTIPDTKGLHLWVRDDLKKYWVFRFTVNGNRHDTGLGSFPEITLADAKHKVAKLRGLLAGVDRAYVGGVERGEHNLTTMTLGQLCEALQVKPSLLFKNAGH